ncbi:MAG: hypothetical protein AUH30_09025 [Candidatus Rokubacteria bacterium 13_1_40CM_68_15]|nr:MAG: hypothetical protein AUH30_09025 [Candidatus Rokubacteria bacterium 13_1_40CM_68_15]
MIGGAVLAIWFDVDPSGKEEVEAWYPRQHLPERLSVPGFLRGRRYAVAGDGPAFFTLYETRDGGVLSSPAYIESLNSPTDWTRRSLSAFRGMIRTAYQRLASGAADTVASHVLTVRIKPDSGRGPYVRQWLQAEAASALGGLAGVSAWGSYVSESGSTSVVTEERKIVGEVSAATPFLTLLEIGDAGVEGALREFWPTWGRKMAAETTVNLYRLMYGLAWLPGGTS